jgi:flagellar basal-body rod protein FlgB
MNIDEKTLSALQMAIKFREMRQEILTSNIANSETPGYKAKKIDFEAALGRALDVDGQLNMNTNSEKHYNIGNGGFKNLAPEIYDDPNGIVNENGNTVDVEQEMAKMNSNNLMFQTTVELLKKKLGLIKYAISSEK